MLERSCKRSAEVYVFLANPTLRLETRLTGPSIAQCLVLRRSPIAVQYVAP